MLKYQHRRSKNIWYSSHSLFHAVQEISLQGGESARRCLPRHRAGGGPRAGGAPAGYPRQEHGHHAAVQVGLKGLCHGGGPRAGGAPAGHPRQEHGHHAPVQVGLKGLCHDSELEEAHEPGELQQVIQDKARPPRSSSGRIKDVIDPSGLSKMRKIRKMRQENMLQEAQSFLLSSYLGPSSLLPRHLGQASSTSRGLLDHNITWQQKTMVLFIYLLHGEMRCCLSVTGSCLPPTWAASPSTPTLWSTRRRGSTGARPGEESGQ